MPNNLDIHDERERNKYSLEAYHLDKTNVYDFSIDKLIYELRSDITKSQTQIDDWDHLKKNDPKHYKEMVEQAERYDIDLEYQQFDNIGDIIYTQEQLLSLVEMKIIYAFKFLEITIKKLLQASFSLESTKEFYKWDNLVKFLKSKNVDIKSLSGYPEICELKNVNNAIKHLDEYETSLNIIEFKNSNVITYYKLDLFYERIKGYPDLFLQELVLAIHDELYKFNDSKLENIANELSLRMNKDDAMKLIDKIKNNYD